MGTDQTVRGKWALTKQREANGQHPFHFSKELHWIGDGLSSVDDRRCTGDGYGWVRWWMGVAGYVNCRIWLNIYIYMVMIGVAEFVVVHWGRLWLSIWLSMVMDRCCRICELQDRAELMVMIGVAEFVVVHWGRLWLSMVMDRCCRICELQDTAEYMVMIGLAEFVVVHWGRLWLSMVMDRCCRICELQDRAEYIYRLFTITSEIN